MTVSPAESAATASVSSVPPGAGWYPAAIERGEVVWLFAGDCRFNAPFYEDVVSLRRNLPRCRTPLSALLEIPEADTLPPAAFIFHASRCGSTLLMQMLASLPACRCISEPPALDELLSQLLSVPEDRRDHLLLRGLIRTWGRRQIGVQHLFIKCDSWHLAALPLVQRAFPGVPCWFLHRDPAAILRSHRRERGSQMVPGMRNLAPFGIDTAHVPVHDLDLRGIAVLTAIFRSASGFIASGTLRPLAGDALPLAIDAGWLALHGVSAGPDDMQRMHRRTAFHSKRPSEPWQPELPPTGGENAPGFAELRHLWQALQR